MPVLQSSGGFRDNTDDANPSSNVTGYCYCGKGEDYDCMIDWLRQQGLSYHYSCLKITAKDVPKGKYFCPECHMQKSKNTRTKKK